MRRRAAATLGLALAICALAPATASAFNLLEGICAVAGATFASPWEAKICKGGAQLASGHVGGVLHTIAGRATQTAAASGLAALLSWVLGGAAFVLHETAKLLGTTTNPQLGAAWFSSSYLHMAAIATLLTLPFVFAAAVQAMMRSDLAMLARAALGYLPLAMLAIAIAVPLTTLLLAASDSLSNIIEQAAGAADTHFLIKATVILAGLTALAHSPFVAFLIGFFVAAGALFLWLELLLREVAVYVIVLMLPLVFASFVWPARRIWAIRAVEMLVALILAKLVIVSVLALGGGALDHATASASIASLMAGIALLTIGAFAPWALVKLLPLGELAAAAAGPLRGEVRGSVQSGGGIATPWAGASSERAGDLIADMHRQGADAEATRLSELGAADSREPVGNADGVEGVTGGGSPDPLRGTADPPGGPTAGAPSDSGPSGSPAAPGTPPDQRERGPAPPFAGFEGAEAMWQKEREWPTVSLGPDGVAPPPDAPPPQTPPPEPPGPAPDDPRPAAQDPEDGRL